MSRKNRSKRTGKNPTRQEDKTELRKELNKEEADIGDLDLVDLEAEDVEDSLEDSPEDKAETKIEEKPEEKPEIKEISVQEEEEEAEPAEEEKAAVKAELSSGDKEEESGEDHEIKTEDDLTDTAEDESGPEEKIDLDNINRDIRMAGYTEHTDERERRSEHRHHRHHSDDSHSKRMKKSARNRIVAILALVIPILLILGGATWFFLSRNGSFARKEKPVSQEQAMAETGKSQASVEQDQAEFRDIEPLDDFGGEKWNEGIIRYQGRYYQYNDNLQNYLFMGIDNDGIATQAVDGISGGQSDAMFLLCVDEMRRDLKVISINRNTIVPVDVYDREGNFLVQMDLQICLQHGYGDGLKLSCMRSVEAVDRLFRDVPISGYLSLNMGGIPAINDAVGGVEITPIETVAKGDIVITKDKPVNLTGEQAYVYLRTRDVDEFASANDRLARQQQYVTAFIEKLLKEPGLGSKVYDAGKEYMVASIDLPKLINSAKGMTFSEDDMYGIEGETEFKDGFERYNVDENAMIQLILDVFYINIG